MRSRHVLLLDGAGAAVYRCNGTAVHAEGRFADAAAIRVYLRRYPRDRYFVLVDIADESYATEDIPHVVGRDRQALLARKAAQHGRGSALAAAVAIERQSTGRRDDRVTFATLTNPGIVEPWLQELTQADVALAGMYSLPQVVTRLAAKSGKECRVILTLGNSGLRQTVVSGGQLRFSRLTPLPDRDIEALAAACRDETVVLHRYLCAQRLIEHGTQLPVAILAHPRQLESFRIHCRDTGDLRFDCLDLVAAAGHRGLTSELPDSHGDVLFAHLLVRQPPRRQFAPPAMLRRWRLGRFGRMIDGVGIATLAAALAFAAIRLPQTLRVQEEVERLRAQNDAEENLQRGSAHAMRHAALPSAPAPLSLLGPLSAALDDEPAVELERLDWNLVDAADGGAEPSGRLDVHAKAPVGARQSALAERLRHAGIDVRVTQQPQQDAEDGLARFAIRLTGKP